MARGMKDEKKLQEQLLHALGDLKVAKAKAKKSAKTHRDNIAEIEETVEKLRAELAGEGEDDQQLGLGAETKH